MTIPISNLGIKFMEFKLEDDQACTIYSLILYIVYWAYLSDFASFLVSARKNEHAYLRNLLLIFAFCIITKHKKGRK